MHLLQGLHNKVIIMAGKRYTAAEVRSMLLKEAKGSESEDESENDSEESSDTHVDYGSESAGSEDSAVFQGTVRRGKGSRCARGGGKASKNAKGGGKVCKGGSSARGGGIHTTGSQGDGPHPPNPPSPPRLAGDRRQHSPPRIGVRKGVRMRGGAECKGEDYV